MPGSIFAFAGAGKAILRMDMAKASLEDIFIELTGNEAAETGQTPSGDAEGRESEGSGE